MNTFSTPAYEIISQHGFAEVRRKKENGQNALFANKRYKAGDFIAHFTAGTISAEPTYLTVQVGLRKHITLDPEFLQYINHGCEPNVFFDTTRMEVIALKDIREDEEFTFFYPSTEWK